MRTEDDIRRALDLEPDHDALTRLTQFSSDLGADDLHADEVAGHDLSGDDRGGGHTDDHVRTPRRRLLPLLAAAAVVVIAGGAVALVHAQDDSRTPPAGGDPHRSTAAQRRPVYDLRIRPVPGYVVTRVRAVGVGTTTGGATASVDATSAERPERGEVYTCESRRLSACNVPTPGAHGQRVTIHGRTGSFVPGRPVTHSSRTKDDGHPWSAARDDDRGPGLSYVGDRHTVVIITGTFGFNPRTYDYDNALAKRIMLRIASATSVGHHDPVLMPFALRDVPGRVSPEVSQIGVGVHCIAYGTGRPAHEFGSVLTACRVRTGPSRSATIKAAADIDPHEDTVVVHDFPGHTSIVIGVDRGQGRLVSRAQARRLAENADVSPDLRDPSTWIAVR